MHGFNMCVVLDMCGRTKANTLVRSNVWAKIPKVREKSYFKNNFEINDDVMHENNFEVTFFIRCDRQKVLEINRQFLRFVKQCS